MTGFVLQGHICDITNSISIIEYVIYYLKMGVVLVFEVVSETLNKTEQKYESAADAVMISI